MKGPDRHFYGEGDHKGPEGHRLDHLDRHTNWNPKERERLIERRPDAGDLDDIERSCDHSDQRNSEQQAQRPGHREDQKFEGCVVASGDFPPSHLARALLTSPLIDQEVHRNQADFPE